MIYECISYNKSKHTNQDNKCAIGAQKLQTIEDFPSYRGFCKSVKVHKRRNALYQPCNVDKDKCIFGPNINILKDKTTSICTTNAGPGNMKIPPTILTGYKYVVLTTNIMKIDKIKTFHPKITRY